MRKREERAGLISLLQETNSTVTVRILMPAFELEKSVKGRFDENQRIKAQYFLDSSLQTNLSKLVVDKKFSLVVEIKDELKIILTRRLEWHLLKESIVLIHDSMFEMLWIHTELYQTNSTK